MSRGNGGGGCSLAIAGVIAIGILVWVLAAGLWVLGVVIMIVSVLAGMMLVYGAWSEFRAHQESKLTEAEVKGMVEDCVRDLLSAEYKWADAVNTKGIGTPMEKEFLVHPGLAEQQRREIESMIRLLNSAPETEQRLEAVSKAEALRVKVEAMLAHRPAGF
ncbi:hypothetical protein ACWIB8_01165 [Corynebacterium flavescens]